MSGPLRPLDNTPSGRRRLKKRSESSGDALGFSRIFSTDNHDSSPIEHTIEPPSAREMDASIEPLLDRVHEAGEMLIKDRGYGAAKRYREAVQVFLRAVVPEAVSVETHESGHGILSRKRYMLLTQINARVERLVAGVLQAQSEQMEILSRLEEIEGMLVDLIQ